MPTDEQAKLTGLESKPHVPWTRTGDLHDLYEPTYSRSALQKPRNLGHIIFGSSDEWVHIGGEHGWKTSTPLEDWYASRGTCLRVSMLFFTCLTASNRDIGHHSRHLLIRRRRLLLATVHGHLRSRWATRAEGVVD